MGELKIYTVIENGPECSSVMSDFYLDKDIAIKQLDNIAIMINEDDKSVYADKEPTLGLYSKVNDTTYKKKLYNLRVQEFKLNTTVKVNLNELFMSDIGER